MSRSVRDVDVALRMHMRAGQTFALKEIIRQARVIMEKRPHLIRFVTTEGYWRFELRDGMIDTRKSYTRVLGNFITRWWYALELDAIDLYVIRESPTRLRVHCPKVRLKDLGE